MRIGTWNLAGRWSDAHAALLASADCDVWLLTEVSDRLLLDGYVAHRTEHEMVKRRCWAAILSRTTLDPLPDPHVASAMAGVDDTTFVSSVLPWRACGDDPWGEKPHAARTERAVAEIFANLPPGQLVWGGDWNHALEGREYAGTHAGRRFILAALEELDLQVPTRDLPAACGDRSIDHIAVSASITATAEHVEAVETGKRVSDHDLSIVETGPG